MIIERLNKLHFLWGIFSAKNLKIVRTESSNQFLPKWSIITLSEYYLIWNSQKFVLSFSSISTNVEFEIFETNYTLKLHNFDSLHITKNKFYQELEPS